LQVFSDDMMGRTDPDTHTVVSGRWKNLEIHSQTSGGVSHHATPPLPSGVLAWAYLLYLQEKIVKGVSARKVFLLFSPPPCALALQVQNSYGLMRAPWNANGNAYLTRYTTFCGQDYQNSLLTFPSCSVRAVAVVRIMGNGTHDSAWRRRTRRRMMTVTMMDDRRRF
jgi:predicted protein tyrosine phosphatase